MYYEEAMSLIRKNGGYMYRLIDVDKCRYYIRENRFWRSFNSRFSNDTNFNIHEEVNRIYGADLTADDWQVDMSGCWKDQ